MGNGDLDGARALAVNSPSAPMRWFQLARDPFKLSNFAMQNMFEDIKDYVYWPLRTEICNRIRPVGPAAPG